MTASHAAVRKALIPAAGLGTRLAPLTLSQPKEMIACGRLPVIGHVLDELRSAGITDLLVVSRTGKSMLDDYIHGAWPGAYVVHQERAGGLGDAVRYARGWAGAERFVVALGDTIVRSSHSHTPLQRLVQASPSPEASLVLVRHVPAELVPRYGIVKPQTSANEHAAFPLADIIEKPALHEAPSDIAIAGRYLFSSRIFDALDSLQPGRGSEIQLTDAMVRLAAQPGGMHGLLLQPGERRFDIGSYDSYYEAFRVFSELGPARPAPA